MLRRDAAPNRANLASSLPPGPDDDPRKKASSGMRKNSCALAGFLSKFWCRRRDSNSHSLRHYPLKIACLPISPRRLETSILPCLSITYQCSNCVITRIFAIFLNHVADYSMSRQLLAHSWRHSSRRCAINVLAALTSGFGKSIHAPQYSTPKKTNAPIKRRVCMLLLWRVSRAGR